MRALAARGDAAGAAWLVGSSPARGLVNNAAYAAALKACGKAGDSERAEKLLAEMREDGGQLFEVLHFRIAYRLYVYPPFGCCTLPHVLSGL